MITTETLTCKAWLASHEEEMTAYLTGWLGVPANEAELAITQLHDRWVARLVKEHSMTPDLAAEALTKAIEFLVTSEPGESPSPLADDGWHTMILYTREYKALCHALAGRFIHHIPTDIIGINATAKADCDVTCKMCTGMEAALTSCDQGGGDCTAPPARADCGPCRTDPCDKG